MKTPSQAELERTLPWCLLGHMAQNLVTPLNPPKNVAGIDKQMG